MRGKPVTSLIVWAQIFGSKEGKRQTWRDEEAVGKGGDDEEKSDHIRANGLYDTILSD